MLAGRLRAGGVATGCIAALMAGSCSVVLTWMSTSFPRSCGRSPARSCGTASATTNAASLSGKISTSWIYLAVGIAIGTLLTAVLSRTATDPERSWQRR